LFYVPTVFDFAPSCFTLLSFTGIHTLFVLFLYIENRKPSITIVVTENANRNLTGCKRAEPIDAV